MFLIGQFSQMARVSRRQLRHYDELGLLRPERIDPVTGYRSYTAAQLPRLNRILALKELGFALDQIGPLLDGDVDTAELRGMLELRRAEVAHNLAEEQARLAAIESRIDELDSPRSPDDVVVKTIAAERFLHRPVVCPTASHAPALVATLLEDIAAAVPASAIGPVVAVARSDEFADADVELDLGVILRRPVDVDALPRDDDRKFSIDTLPAIERSATVVRTGDISQAHRAYAAVARWAEATGHHLAGPIREVVIQLSEPARPEATALELQVPVTRA